MRGRFVILGEIFGRARQFTGVPNRVQFVRDGFEKFFERRRQFSRLGVFGIQANANQRWSRTEGGG